MKKDNKLTIVIMVLVMLLAGGVGYFVGYFCYDKLNPKDNLSDVKNEDTNKLESRDLSNDELSTLTSKIDEYNRNFGQYYPIDNMSKISSDDLFLFAINGVRKPGDEVFDATEMKNYINNYFDDSIKLKNEDFHCLSDKKLLYKYDEGTNKYTFVKEGHMHGGSQGAHPSEISTKILNSKYEDGIYTINVKVFYGNSCSDTCGPAFQYYKSFNDAIEEKDVVATRVDYMTEDEKDSYREKLPTTTYKFKKNGNGNIVLVSVEVK